VQINIIKHALLENIPSGSGIELINGIIYIIGDDSEYLYGLNQELKVIHQVALFPCTEKKDGRIPKPVKPDFENMVSFDINGYPHLFVAGSGSRLPQRGIGYLIKLPTSYNKKHLVWQKDLNALYHLITSHPDFSENMELNIESCFIAEEYFYFINRSGQELIRYPLAEMVEYLQNHSEATPFPEILLLEIAPIDGNAYTCSGACYFKGTIYVSASCEATDNAYDDGDIIGSAVGYIALSDIPTRGRDKTPQQKIPVRDLTTIKDKNGTLLKTKWESICLYEHDQDGTVAALAISDLDNGTSELFLLEMKS
jgi:hypothetical protein